MPCVVSQADPTKLMSTFMASHMIAPTILFYRPFALRTVLSVDLEPIERLPIAFTFNSPLLHLFTGSWLMTFIGTPRAHNKTSLAVYH